MIQAASRPCAAAALQSLPSKDQIEPIVALAKEVPAPQFSKPAVVEFRECLELSSAG